MSSSVPVSRPENVVDEHADGLCAFIDASPSPFHAVETTAAMLDAVGFVRLSETQAWGDRAARAYVVREGSLVAWSRPQHLAGVATPFRVIGAHTDSPNLRVRPRPDVSRAGWDQLGVEVYGGPLLNSWLDRDLGLSGRVAVRSGAGVAQRLVRVDDPVLRVPQLAIHLDRGVDDGLRLNPQTQLVPVWGATGSAPSFRSYLADLLEIDSTDVLSWDVMTHDLTPSRRIGRERDLIAAPRLDNQGTCYAGTRAFMAATSDHAERLADVPVLVLFDHEEIGSTTNRGGDSQLLPSMLERVVLSAGGGREDVLRAMAGSVVASGDMAHAVHPNYVERLEPGHLLAVNGGPVLKVNQRGRYASDALGSGIWALACEQAGVPMQTFVSRGDMPCGSTIGPMTAALTGAITVDVGAPMLSMHSARELCGAVDPSMYVAALTAFLAPRI